MCNNKVFSFPNTTSTLETSRDGGPRVSEQFSDHCPGLTTMMWRRWVLTCCCYLPSDRENVLNVNTVFCFSESWTCRLATSDKPTLGSIYSSRVFTGVISPMAAGGSGENSSGNGPGCGLGCDVLEEIT